MIAKQTAEKMNEFLGEKFLYVKNGCLKYIEKFGESASTTGGRSKLGHFI